METRGFCHYDLRTTDPDGARLFYTEALGLDFAAASADAPPHLVIWPLHEQARARGAPAHWLGHIGVADVDAVAARLREAGSEPLGARQQRADGSSYAVVRDPFGAVVAVRQPARRPRAAPVVWHQLHTRDLDAAWKLYEALFGWSHTASLDVPDPSGGHRLFAWEGSAASVGSMANTARWAGVHPHWLFYFPVSDLDAALARVVARGGVSAASPIALPNGDRLVPCDDPQGAAFGLYETATKA
jgi:hypothetical protein